MRHGVKTFSPQWSPIDHAYQTKPTSQGRRLSRGYASGINTQIELCFRTKTTINSSPFPLQHERKTRPNVPTRGSQQVGVFNTDDLRTVFTLAGSAEEKCARDAAITLGNLAVVTRNQQAITEAGGLPPLVTMLGGNPYLSCQKFAARALYRLAAHGDSKPRIVEAGALPPLVRRLRSPDAEVARWVWVVFWGWIWVELFFLFPFVALGASRVSGWGCQ